MATAVACGTADRFPELSGWMLAGSMRRLLTGLLAGGDHRIGLAGLPIPQLVQSRRAASATTRGLAGFPIPQLVQYTKLCLDLVSSLAGFPIPQLVQSVYCSYL